MLAREIWAEMILQERETGEDGGKRIRIDVTGMSEGVLPLGDTHQCGQSVLAEWGIVSR